MDKQNIRIHLRAYDNKILDLSTIEIINTAKRTGAQVKDQFLCQQKKKFSQYYDHHIQIRKAENNLKPGHTKD